MTGPTPLKRLPWPTLPRRPAPALALTALLLAGCATALPPITWVRLPARPLAAASAAASAPSPATVAVWQLVQPVGLPGHLDRDALLVPTGTAGLQPLGGARWAEPLRDAVPRLLRDDLQRLRGAPLWQAPLPPGLRATWQLRLEVGALDVAPDGRSVRLQARWSLADAAGTRPPRLAEADLSVAAPGAGADALAQAHRQALWQLAERIVETP